MSLTMNNNNYWMVVNAEGSDGAPVKVDFLNLKKGALILRALNHKLRQQIIRLLDENKKLTVTEIYVHLRLEQSVASQHLPVVSRVIAQHIAVCERLPALPGGNRKRGSTQAAQRIP